MEKSPVKVTEVAYSPTDCGEWLGQHVVAEFFDCDFDKLNDAPKLEEAMKDAARAAEATILTSHHHFFEPHGVSSIVIIQESNLCIHTWPEFGYAAADFFTCGSDVDPWKSFDFLKGYLKSRKTHSMEIKRGCTKLIENPELQEDSVKHDSIEGDLYHTVNQKEPWMDTVIKMRTESEPLFDKQTEFQKVCIARNKWWGKILWLDNKVNLTERDEFVYHEMIAHVPLLTHANPKSVLIIGGGDGAAAREVLKHTNVEKVTLVDIDKEVIDACKKHIPTLSNGAFEDPRVELVIEDGIDFVKKQEDGVFDVVIVDSIDPNPNSVGEVLFTQEFYQNCHRILNEHGVLSAKSDMPMREKADDYVKSLENIQTAFTKEHAYIYLIPIDTQNGQLSLSLCFKGDSHPDKFETQRAKTFCQGKQLKYYNHKIHPAAFCLPNYIKQMISV